MNLSREKSYPAHFAVKTLLFWLVFLAIMLLYRFFPVFPFSIISCTNESNYQHYKLGFFAYLITCGIEYLMYRKRIIDRQSFLYSRLAVSLFLPWIIFLVWYIAPAAVGQMPVPLEIVWANLAVLLVGLCAVSLETGWVTAVFTRPSRIVIWVLLFLTIALFLRFTFGPLPWADVFLEPDWR
ncbi:MAG: hypothetical protein EHM41_18495 [Chloroflexi bacterium]|nr:MAG: hypothetical protein EHM41_18495 [Chloroflexota bacterium]